MLGPVLLARYDVSGWVNVPADCVTPAQCVRLHAGRPAGVNEPRPEGVAGTRRILEIVSSLGPRDLCFCLLTGGGSALLPAPVPEISLSDKVRVTQLLSAAGANIEQLNTVRRHLSLVKGGGLARACGGGRLITLLISDVLGDPLEMIGSGPTVPGVQRRATHWQCSSPWDSLMNSPSSAWLPIFKIRRSNIDSGKLIPSVPTSRTMSWATMRRQSMQPVLKPNGWVMRTR